MSHEDFEAAMGLLRRRTKEKKGGYYLDLQENERTLLNAASRIYSAYLHAGRVPEGSDREFRQTAIEEAIQMAVSIDELVNDADEERAV